MNFKKLAAAGGVIALLFTGCGIEQAMREDTLYQRVIPYVQEKELSVSFETKALLDAVYLNPLYPGRFKTPTFLVGVYNDCDNNLTGCQFSLTLNDRPPIEINSTIPDFILYKSFPFYNNWSNYYLVKFPAVSPPYRLVYKNPYWGKIEMEWSGKECNTTSTLSN